MKTLRTVCHLIKADFLERVRGYGFLITVGLAMLMGYNVIIGRFGITLGGYEGATNAAWVGTVMTVTMTPYVMLLGFYLVRGSINRDQQTGVGQIIATTPIRKSLYTVGKFVSNFLTLAAMVGVLILAGVVMLLIQGRGQSFNLWVLIAPFIFITLPAAAIAAGIAILFDSIPGLNQGLGNILYIFGFYAMIMGSFTFLTPARQMLGFNLIDEQIVPVLSSIDPSYNGRWALGVIPPGEKSFLWEGYTWTGKIVLNRAIWVVVAVVLALIAALPFDRFDPAQQKLKREKRGILQRVWTWGNAILRGDFFHRNAMSANKRPEKTAISLTPLTGSITSGYFWRVVLGELKLLFKGHVFIWYIAAIGLNIACVVSPPDMVQQILIPLVWLWPVLIWSQLGTREMQYNTRQMVFSTPRPVAYQTPALWLAAVCFTAITTSGTAIHFAISGNITRLLVWGVGVLFVSTLALALGVWSKTNRLFEVIYSFIWYFGFIEQIPTFDFTGATIEGLSRGIPVVYLGATVGLALMAVFGRWRQHQI